VRVADAAQGLRRKPNSISTARIAGQAGMKDLSDALPTELPVLGQEHLTHAARAKLPSGAVGQPAERVVLRGDGFGRARWKQHDEF
jgi:hypothetical protein